MRIFIDFIFNMDPIGIFFGLLSTIVGAVAGYFFSRKISKEATEASNRNAIDIINRQQSNIAAAKFRSAFVETKRLLDKSRLYDLSTQYDDPVFDVLKNHIVNHERAKIRFSAFVSKNDMVPFNSAWDIYYSKSQDRADYPLNDYDCARDSRTNKILDESLREKRRLAIDRIDNLLEFAKHK